MITMLRTHTCGELSKANAGETVTLCGWVNSARVSSKIGFVDLRDRYGITQVFITKDIIESCRGLHREDIIKVTGLVKARPENQVKGTGTLEIELSATAVEILKKVPELPLEISGDIESNEETRLKYRYLDLRSSEMQKAIIIRHKLIKAIRDFMDSEGFLDIETPILAKATPEGARDYIVPSRTFPKNFFALPQSPQVFKQLLMVSGFDKYFQIARCFRDEDLRADRQPEFTQLDVEMSFVEEEDLFDLIERLMQFVFKQVLEVDLKIPFTRMTHADAKKKHNSDKPDLREISGDKFAFVWITEFPMFEWNEEKQRFNAEHHPFTSPQPEDIKFLHSDKGKVRSRAYDLALNGFELGGGSIRIHDSELQADVFKALGLDDAQVQRKFGFLLEALKFAPPHGGLAFGIDRWAMIMAGKENIREVIAFPKNKDAKDLMLDAPSVIDKEHLDDLHVQLKK